LAAVISFSFKNHERMQLLYYLMQFLIEQAARMQPDRLDPMWPRRRKLAVIPGRASSREPGIHNPCIRVQHQHVDTGSMDPGLRTQVGYSRLGH